MRKQDLIEGEEYAAGPASRYDKWKRARVKVVEIDGTRQVPHRFGGTIAKRGIVVEFIEDSNVSCWNGKAGDVRVVDSAREIHELWSTYAVKKAEVDRETNERLAERQRQHEVAKDVIVRLRRIGVDVRYVNGAFTISADVMAEIVERLSS